MVIKKEREKQGKEWKQQHASELEQTEIPPKNEKKWNPIIAWQDYEDANHHKRAILEVLMPSGVENYKVVPNTRGNGVVFSVELPSFVLNSTRLLSTIYSDIPSYHPMLLGLEKGIKELKESTLEMDGCWYSAEIF